MNNTFKIKILVALVVAAFLFGCLKITTNTPSTAQKSTKTVKGNSTKTKQPHMNNTSQTQKQTNHKQQSKSNSTAQTMGNGKLQVHQLNLTDNSQPKHKAENKNTNKISMEEFIQKNGPIRCVQVNRTTGTKAYFWASENEIYFHYIIKLDHKRTRILDALMSHKYDTVYLNTTQLFSFTVPLLNASFLNCISSKCQWFYVENKTGIEKLWNNKDYFPANVTLTSYELVNITPNLACAKAKQPFPLSIENLTHVCDKEEYHEVIQACANATTH